MNDLEERTYQEACAVLGFQQSTLQRYGQIVVAQGHAVACEDLDRVSELAESVDVLIAEMAASGRRVEPLQRRLRSRALSGPRADALRRLMTDVADSAAATEAAVRRLVTELARRRNDLGRRLAALDAAAAAGTSYTTTAPPRLGLDRVG